MDFQPDPNLAPPVAEPPVEPRPSAVSGIKGVKRSRRRRIFFAVLRTFVLVSIVAAAGAAAGGYLWLKDLGVFELDDARLKVITDFKSADNSLVFDRDGAKIGEFFNTYHVFVPYAQLPKNLENAILAIEDRSFWTHRGYDPRGIARAALARLQGKKREQGASTITQQVVRQFLLSRERTITRKVQEIAMSIQLERRMDKKKILEIYTNALFLGNGAYGVGAASFRYFGKPVAELTVPEAALIAGLFQSPSRYNPKRYPKRAQYRQHQVLVAMKRAGFLTDAETRAAFKARLAYQEYQPMHGQVAPFFVDYVREQAAQALKGRKGVGNDGGLRIYTTLDRRLQAMAERSIDEAAPTLDAAAKKASPVRGENGKLREPTIEAALLSIDPTNGEILAMVGGRNYQKNQFNRTVSATRSPGSAFKPIVYSTALLKGRKWSDVIFVSPVMVSGGYRPRGSEDDMMTETTLMRAFYRSMNPPTVELGTSIGIQPIIDQAKLLGIRSELKAEAGTMLGGSDVTMMDLGRVYSTFANRGTRVEPISITKITDRTGKKVLYEAPDLTHRSARVLAEQVAFLMTEGMRAVLTMGTGFRSAALSHIAVGKTGTSNESRDNWFCGYTTNLATVVWVGSDEHSQLLGTSAGNTLALPIWDSYLHKAINVRKPGAFRVPSGVVSASVHPNYGHRSPGGVRMYFLRGLEPPDEPSALEALSQGGGSYRDVFAH